MVWILPPPPFLSFIYPIWRQIFSDAQQAVKLVKCMYFQEADHIVTSYNVSAYKMECLPCSISSDSIVVLSSITHMKMSLVM